MAEASVSKIAASQEWPQTYEIGDMKGSPSQPGTRVTCVETIYSQAASIALASFV